MALRPCTVSFADGEGLRRSVEVQAEAAILALKVFQGHDCCPAPHTRIDVEVRTAVTHSVTVKRIKDWLEGSGKSPAERLLRNRLRELMSEVKGQALSRLLDRLFNFDRLAAEVTDEHMHL